VREGGRRDSSCSGSKHFLAHAELPALKRIHLFCICTLKRSEIVMYVLRPGILLSKQRVQPPGPLIPPARMTAL
jgi:hypothetical protein